MKPKSFFFFLTLGFTLTLQALTLDEAVSNALSLNPEIVEKEKRYSEIAYDIEMAKSGYLPKVDILADTSLYDSRVGSMPAHKFDFEAIFSQNLFRGFGDISKYKLELSKYESAFYTMAELKNEFSFGVIQSYINILRENEILHIEKSSIENHQNIFKKITSKYNAGAGNRLEFRLSKTSLNLAKLNFFEQENTAYQTVILLDKYLFTMIDPDELIVPNDDVKIPTTLEEAIEFAYNNHPSMKIARLNKEFSEHEIAYIKKDLYPSLDFNANYFTGDDNNYKGSDEYYELKLQLSYNLYNGSYDINQKRKMQEKLLQKNALITKTKNDIRNKLTSKYSEYEILKDKIALLQEYLTSKELTLESYYDAFSIGQAKLRDILDTTESLYGAKKMYINGKYDLLISKYSILEAMGTLPKYEHQINYNLSQQNTDTQQRKQINKTVTVKESNSNDTHCYKVNATKLNIREKMDTQSKIIGIYEKNSTICSDTVKGLWVQTDGGWVSKTYLQHIKEDNK